MSMETQGHSIVSTPTAWKDDEQRLESFAATLDDIRVRAEGRMGEEDVKYIRRMDRFSRAMEIVGRVLIHISPDPFTFLAGVSALAIHKQLQAAEIGHAALHGAFDTLDLPTKYRAENFSWDIPIDEESWRKGHNIRHHGFTNVAGRDPDIHFGPVRLTEQTPHRTHNNRQLSFMMFALAPNFGLLMSMHFTGLSDVYLDNGLPQKHDALPDRSWKSIAHAHWLTLRKWIPYYAKNYVFFPMLAGPMFWKVLLGNWMAETARDVYSAATIYCGHVGQDVASYPLGTKAKGRGAWYAMQCDATNNFDVSRPLSILCGALDRQIEHHLFPKLPPERLREIAPEVRAACEAHGVAYRTDTWGRTLAKAMRFVRKLSAPSAGASEQLRDLIDAGA